MYFCVALARCSFSYPFVCNPAPQGGGIQGKLADSEADGGANGSARRIVGVGIPVVADMADVRGVAAIDGQQPPGAPRPSISYTLNAVAPRCRKYWILSVLYRAVSFSSPMLGSVNFPFARHPQFADIVKRGSGRISQRRAACVSRLDVGTFFNYLSLERRRQ